MASKEKSSKRDGSPSPAIDSTRPAKAGADVQAGSFSGVPSDSALLGAKDWSFNAVLRRVLEFCRAAELEGGAGQRRAKAASATNDASNGASTPAFDALRLFVRSLDLQTQDKLRALMRAGHEALPLHAAVAALAAERAGLGESALELFAGGAVEFQDLQRGHAVACATAFDLELDFAVWGASGEPQSLDERVWLRFGRELAQSRIEEWTCFAVVDSRDRLQKLYLRRGKSRWWSFATLIDRPSDRALGVPASARSGRAGLVVLPVQVALGRACRANLRAVRRASLAVSARLGQRRPSPRRGAVAAKATQ